MAIIESRLKKAEDVLKEIEGLQALREKVLECRRVFGMMSAGCDFCSFRDEPEMCAFDRYDVAEADRQGLSDSVAKFVVGEKADYFNHNTGEWEPVRITGTGFNDNSRVYDNDGGHWGYENQYRGMEGEARA